MAVKKTYKLDLNTVLQALDRKDLGFYSRLSEEEKKAYVPLVLMRYMSSLTDQSKMAAYAVIATNDLVNIGFWELSKHPELQHQLLCLTGLGGKQYRTWLSAKRKKKSNKIDDWLLERLPEMNDDELSLFKSEHDTKSWTTFVKGSGVSDAEVKDLIDAWKKNEA
jgi:hypothetical protein